MPIPKLAADFAGALVHSRSCPISSSFCGQLIVLPKTGLANAAYVLRQNQWPLVPIRVVRAIACTPFLSGRASWLE
jgi:hypothetical protein